MDQYFKQCVDHHCKVIKQQPKYMREILVAKSLERRQGSLYLVFVNIEDVGVTFRHNVITRDPGAILVSVNELHEFWPLQPQENYKRVLDIVSNREPNEVVFVHILRNTSIVTYNKLTLL